MSTFQDLTANDSVLQNIFNYLPLREAMAVSTVCRHWNQLIFSNNCIHRFTLVLDLDRPQPQLDQMFKTVQESDRDYYSIVLRTSTELTGTALDIFKYFIRKSTERSSKSLFIYLDRLRLESRDPKRPDHLYRIQLIDTGNRQILRMQPTEDTDRRMSVLTAISESVPDIENLRLQRICVPEPLEVLSTFRQLKTLVIKEHCSHENPQHPPVILPSLESLSFINVSGYYYFRADNLKRFSIESAEDDCTDPMKLLVNIASRNISELCLHFTEERASDTVQLLVDNVTRNISEVSLHSTERKIAVDRIFENLPRYPHLTTLELGGVNVSRGALRPLDTRNPLRKLIFVKCRMETLELTGLEEKLALLKEWEFRECFLIVPNEFPRMIELPVLEPLRSIIPSCTFTAWWPEE